MCADLGIGMTCAKETKKKKISPTAGGGRAEVRAKKYFFLKKSILKNNSTGTRLRCVENGIGYGRASATEVMLPFR